MSSNEINRDRTKFEKLKFSIDNYEYVSCNMDHLFNRSQLRMVLAFVMISVPWSNQHTHQVISEKLLSKGFHCRTTNYKIEKWDHGKVSACTC